MSLGPLYQGDIYSINKYQGDIYSRKSMQEADRHIHTLLKTTKNITPPVQNASKDNKGAVENG